MRLQVDTDARVELIDVTDDVAAAVPAAVERGVCTVYVPHTTAGVVVNEPEDRLLSDIEGMLERLVPSGDGYAHDAIDDNADAHLRATVLGESATVPVEDGALALGTWQSILFVECDGPRSRELRAVTLPA
ncbi:MAG: secondary thiamine-phosphate synthase enzyme YjbQ [Halobacteriales archaeon]